MSAPPRLECICGGTYATQASLRQHQRRYCRGPSPNNNCTVCGKNYETYSGLRQHMRHSHPTHYNTALETESSNARQAWTEDEENALAREEAHFDGEDLYEHLLRNSSRSKDALKARRKREGYKAKVRTFRQLRQEEQTAQPDTTPEQDNTTESSVLEALRNAIREIIRSVPPDSLDHLTLALRAAALGDRPDITREALDALGASLATKYGREGRNSNSSPARNNQRKSLIRKIGDPNTRRRAKRRLEYRLAQMDITQDQKSYANRLIDGRPVCNDGQTPSPEVLRASCADTFSTPSVDDTEPIKVVHNETNICCKPISASDIEAALKTTSSEAAGSDGISLRRFRNIPQNTLILLYNSMLLWGYTPESFRKGRTILIPKKDNHRQDPANWRPITISSIVGRIFNRILAARLGSISLNSCQRGFTKIDGCFANYASIETIIKSRKKAGKPLSLIFLDLSKAFDTVSHQSINRALKRLNVDPITTEYIMDSYKNSTTSVTCENTTIGTFQVKRGVKQGDPHSPFLFNAVTDELVTNLQEFSGVPISARSKVCALAYADDLVIAATNPNDGQRMLDAAVEFFKKKGLQTNPTKCASIVLNTVPSKKKLFAATIPAFRINNSPIPISPPNEIVKYLGAKFSTEGLLPCDAGLLNEQLSRIKQAPLKPFQKLIILTKYLTPRYIASVQRPNINKKTLKDIDKKLRGATRKILSLFSHCHNAIFHAPQKNGGLGLFNFTLYIPVIVLNRWEKLKKASTLLEDTFHLSSAWVQRVRKLINPDLATKENIKRKLANDLNSSFSGKLENTTHHQACSSYIYNPPKYWTGQDYIRAIQLKYNLLPCKSMPSVPMEERNCRAGCNAKESLSHILQRCPIVHWHRIQRHDYIVKRLKNAAIAKGWEAKIEPHIRCSNGALKKPDILLRKGTKIIISDVGVNWEDRTTLEHHFENKVSTYSTPEFVSRMQELHPTSEIAVLPLIVGARGTWCKLNKAITTELKLTFREILDIITTTMRGGWSLHQDFMRVVWRQVQQNRATQRR